MKLSQDIIQPTAYERLSTDIEQKTSYTLDKCALNVFETHRQAENVRLTFEGFTITSMLRGKKILHGSGRDQYRQYLPGESYILRPDSEMIIDFPEAHAGNPTQCTALVIEHSYLKKQLEYINDLFPREHENGYDWELDLDKLWLQNDEQIATLSNRLMRIFSGNDPLKDILVDLKLKELVLSIMRRQNYEALSERQTEHAVSDRFRAVVEYIRRNITATIHPAELSRMACMSKSVFYRTFMNEFGVPPTRMVLMEKIRHAKVMMVNENLQIKEVCYALGFSDPNYFSRAFKKIEGVSPVEYLRQIRDKDSR